MSDHPDRPPFFVVGSDRSGTTMLMMMLDAHPELGVSRESWFLIDLMDALPLEGPLDDEQVGRAYEILRAHPRWQRWDIPDEQLRAALDALEKPDLATLVEAVFRLDLERNGKASWGDKTPAYVREIDRILTLFPDARFVHLVRDARDVCISLRKVGWHGPTLANMARYWNEHVASGIEAGRRRGEPTYLEIAYEDLVLDVEGQLRRICGFLGVDFDPAMLHWYEQTAEKTADRPMKYQTKLHRAPRPSDVGRWRREMSAFDVAIVETYAGDTMRAVGQTRRFPFGLRALRLVLGLFERTRLALGRAA